MRIYGSVNRTLTLGMVCASMAVVNGCANDAPKKGDSLTGGASTGTATGTPIVVGEFGSLSGSESTFGTSTDNGASGLTLIEEVRPDIAILDVGFPEMDGFEVARRIRRTAS